MDRVRTSVNLYSHCFCTFITNELCKENIEKELNGLNNNLNDLSIYVKNVEDEMINNKQHLISSKEFSSAKYFSNSNIQLVESRF